jgi:hypothetical protein
MKRANERSRKKGEEITPHAIVLLKRMIIKKMVVGAIQSISKGNCAGNRGLT